MSKRFVNGIAICIFLTSIQSLCNAQGLNSIFIDQSYPSSVFAAINVNDDPIIMSSVSTQNQAVGLIALRYSQDFGLEEIYNFVDPNEFRISFDTKIVEHNSSLITAYDYVGIDSGVKLVIINPDSGYQETKILNPYFPVAPFIVVRDLIIHESKIYVLMEIQTQHLDKDIYLNVFDLNGNNLYNKTIRTSFHDSPTCIVAKDSTLLIGSNRNNRNLVDLNYKSQAAITEIDMLGNVVWEYISNDSTLMNGVADIVVHEGEYILFSGIGEEIYMAGPNDIWWNPYVFKIDENENVIWDQLFDTGQSYLDSNFNEAVDVSDGVIGVGQLFTIDPDSIGFNLPGWLVKIDYEGEILWEHEHRYYDSSHSAFHYMYDVSAVGDKIYTVGQARDLNLSTQNGWLLELDSDGCLISDCLTTGILPSQNTFDINPIVHFIPSHSEITIENLPAGHQFDFSLYYMDGRLLTTIKDINLGGTFKVSIPLQGSFLFYTLTENEYVYAGKIGAF